MGFSYSVEWAFYSLWGLEFSMTHRTELPDTHEYLRADDDTDQGFRLLLL